MKVATWNLWWRFGEWNKRLPAIRNVLGATNPDICALQEVWLDGDRDQVRTLVEALAGRTREDYPVVVLGDLNAEPDSDEVRLLCGHKTAPARERFVLVDAWRYAPRGAVPWTWDRAIPHVVSTMEPSCRIDYVLVGPPHDNGRGSVRSIRRIGATPVDGVWPSDHVGLLAELL